MNKQTKQATHTSHLRLYRTKQKNPSLTEHQTKHTQNKRLKKKITNIKTLVAQSLKFPDLVFTLTLEHLRCEAY